MQPAPEAERMKSGEDLANRREMQGKKAGRQVMMVRHLERDGEDEVAEAWNGDSNARTQVAENSIHAPSTCTDTN